MSIRLPDKLIDEPTFVTESFSGYEHFTDPTKILFNRFTFPSQNFTIPSFDKAVPDKGKTLYGQIFNENSGITGNKQKFKNLGGIEMEVRVFPSTNTNLKDVISVGYQNTRLVFSTLVGSFTIGELVSGQTSGAVGRVVSVTGTVMVLSEIEGTFVITESILGLTSGATAVIVKAPDTIFHQITQNVNPLPVGPHEYYFDEWFDTNLNPALSKRLPRLVWVNGYKDPSTKFGAVYSWSGGIAVITSFVVNTSISINPATTWRSLGFTENAGGTASVIINGLEYALTSPSDLDTSTINVTSTTGIAIGDTATSKIEVDVAPLSFDVCRQNKGYMFYGDWDNRQLYQSNAFNRSSVYTISSFQGGVLNDLVIDSNTNVYTGTIESVFHVVIDTVNPNILMKEFFPGGEGNLNDAVWDTSAYSGTAGVTNIYRMTVLGDFTCGMNTIVGSFVIGEVVVGATSGAEAVVVAFVSLGVGVGALGLRMLTTETFFSIGGGEVVTGQTSGATGDTGGSVNFFQNWVQYSKNGTTVNINTGTGAAPVVNLVTTTITLSDGLTIKFANFKGHAVGDVFQLTINQGGIDTFKWQKDGGAFSGSIPITANAFQALSDGVQIKFLNATGHSIGDSWNITAIPSVTRAWDNFYYALPVRRPGEGYIYPLPSNFWTMDTQEESMYVNGSYGEWSVITTELSGDLQSEKVNLTPLKQAGANKVLYPYLTAHINDDLVYINTEKALDTIGRVQFLEKPQTGYLSDAVKLDFLASSFIGGRIKYVGKRIYISSPQDGVLHCYDTFKKYWQPPKTFPEVGLLSIVGNELLAHSNTRNQSFTMFTNDSGDNGQGYLVEMRTGYAAPSGRWRSTFSNASFIEGYITGNPKLIHTVYLGVNGCGGIFPHDLDVVTCKAPDRAPFGEGSFGSHPNGSDLDIQTDYFNEIYKAYSPVLQYYFISLGLSCIAKSHTYSLLSMGMNAMNSPTGNNALVNPSTLVINNPDV